MFPKNLDGPQQGWLTWWQMKSTYSGMLFNGYPSLGSVQGWSGSTVTLTNGSTAVACTGSNCGWQASDFGTYTIYTGMACASGAACKHVPVLFTGDGTAAAAAAFPADSSKTDQTVYCLNGCTFVDSNHFTLDKPYAGATGTHGWVMAVNNNSAGGSFGMVGWAQDSFLEGILGWAFGMAGKAMACAGAGTPANCDNGVSALAYGYSQKAANWLLNYAQLPSYAGMSYWAGAAVCGNPIDPANIWCSANTTVNSITSREIMGDAVRGLMAAYQQAPNAELQAVMDNWYAGMWGKPGSGAVMGTPDGAYDNQFDATGCAVSGSYPVYSGCGGNGFYLTEGPPYSQKFFGQFFGISNLASWPVLRTGGAQAAAKVQV